MGKFGQISRQIFRMRLRGPLGALAIVAACLSACAVPPPNNVATQPGSSTARLMPPIPPKKPIKAARKVPSFTQIGIASWYRRTPGHRRTASGQLLNDHALTAAHRTLPLGTIVRVTNLDNGATVKVRINDRGPFVHGRVIDLSPEAAKLLAMKRAGLAPVRVAVYPSDQRTKEAKALASLLTPDGLPLVTAGESIDSE